jgi:hypothetical protein
MAILFRRQEDAETKKCSLCRLPMVLAGEAFVCRHCDSLGIAPHGEDGCTLCRKQDAYDGVGPKLTQQQIAVVRASRGRGGHRS